MPVKNLPAGVFEFLSAVVFVIVRTGLNVEVFVVPKPEEYAKAVSLGVVYANNKIATIKKSNKKRDAFAKVDRILLFFDWLSVIITLLLLY